MFKRIFVLILAVSFMWAATGCKKDSDSGISGVVEAWDDGSSFDTAPDYGYEPVDDNFDDIPMPGDDSKSTSDEDLTKSISNPTTSDPIIGCDCNNSKTMKENETIECDLMLKHVNASSWNAIFDGVGLEVSIEGSKLTVKGLIAADDEYIVTIIALDESGGEIVSRDVEFEVKEIPNVEITNNSLGSITNDYEFHDYDLSAKGGVEPYEWSVKEIDDLDLKIEENTLSVKATQEGEYTISVTVTDSIGGTDTKDFNLAVNPIEIPASEIDEFGLKVYRVIKTEAYTGQFPGEDDESQDLGVSLTLVDQTEIDSVVNLNDGEEIVLVLRSVKHGYSKCAEISGTDIDFDEDFLERINQGNKIIEEVIDKEFADEKGFTYETCYLSAKSNFLKSVKIDDVVETSDGSGAYTYNNSEYKGADNNSYVDLEIDNPLYNKVFENFEVTLENGKSITFKKISFGVKAPIDIEVNSVNGGESNDDGTYDVVLGEEVTINMNISEGDEDATYTWSYESKITPKKCSVLIEDPDKYHNTYQYEEITAPDHEWKDETLDDGGYKLMNSFIFNDPLPVNCDGENESLPNKLTNNDLKETITVTVVDDVGRSAEKEIILNIKYPLLAEQSANTLQVQMQLGGIDDTWNDNLDAYQTYLRIALNKDGEWLARKHYNLAKCEDQSSNCEGKEKFKVPGSDVYDNDDADDFEDGTLMLTDITSILLKFHDEDSFWDFSADLDCDIQKITFISDYWYATYYDNKKNPTGIEGHKLNDDITDDNETVRKYIENNMIEQVGLGSGANLKKVWKRRPTPKYN